MEKQMNKDNIKIMKEMFEEACGVLYLFGNANSELVQFEDGSWGENPKWHDNPEVYFRTPEDIFRELEYFIYRSDEMFDPKIHESDAVELKFYKQFLRKYKHLRIKDNNYSAITGVKTKRFDTGSDSTPLNKKMKVISSVEDYIS
jgi:hypothetical protein